MHVSVVSIPVSDQDRATKFYTEVLGFQPLADVRMNADMRWVQLSAPDGGATFTLVTWFPSMPAGSLRGVVLEVDDIDAVHAELTAQGYEFPDGVLGKEWGRYITIEDPDGNGLVLQTSARQPVQA